LAGCLQCEIRVCVLATVGHPSYCGDYIAWAVSSELLGFYFFPYLFVSGPCARLSWPSRQLLSAR